MRGIVVQHNTIPFNNQERNTSTSSTAANLPAPRFHDILSAATKVQNDKTLRTGQDQPPVNKNYTVRAGDTLSEIVATESKRLGLNHSRHDLYTMVSQIAGRNHLTNPDTIFPGQEIDLTSIRQSISESVSAPISHLAFEQPLLEPIAEPTSSSATEPLTITKNVPELLPEATFQSPVNGKITSLFGMRNHPILGGMLHHDGIDISQPTGTPVKPLSSGTVTFSGDNGGYGLMVEVDHGNGLTSRYAHLSKLLVHKGEQISPEQTIGKVGQTGRTTGPHLHLEIQRQNSPIDPLTVLNRTQIETGLLFADARKSQRM